LQAKTDSFTLGAMPEAHMNHKFIVIDGKTYNSVDEMPPDIRQKYEQAMSTFKDKNQNNIPDGFEHMNILAEKNNNGIPDIFENMSAASVVSNAMKFIVNGQEFNNLEDLPPEARARYEQAMGNLDKNQNGMPDILEGMMTISNPSTFNVQSAPLTPSPRPASRKPIPVNSTIEPESSGGWMLALTGIILVGLCLVIAAAGVWYFIYR